MSWLTFWRRPHEAPWAHQGPPPLAGRYQVRDQRLGHGAVGQVYEGVDLRTGALVAVKFVPLPERLTTAERRDCLQRLRRELALADRLRHPAIVAIHAVGLDGPQAWLVMERVNGADLGRYTQPSRLLPETVVLHIGARVASALAHAHAQGVVHRDLKPGNVLVDLASGQVKLADFGIARTEDSTLTRTGVTLGTPAYMAPEQLSGEACGPAADTYALGVMLYELLCGRRPHQADSLGALLLQMAQAPHTPLASLRPDLPGAVTGQIEQLLRRNPHTRPANLAIWSGRLAGLAAVMARVNPAAKTPAA